MERIVALPNLLIVGAAKSGTTSLHNYLNQHQDIYMCSPKEPHFLINNEIGKERIPKGILELEAYEQLFEGHENKKYRGESSVMYLSFPELTISNIKKYLSDEVKIIIMLRNPVERAFSGYQHVKRYNVMENLSFEDALEQSNERYQNIINMTPASRYLELGMYSNQVKNFLESFKYVHVIIYDDYKANFNLELKKVFSFLGLNNIEIDTQKRHMVGGWQWKNEWMKSLMVKDNPIKTLFKFLLPFKSVRKHVRGLLQRGNTRIVEGMSPKTESWLKAYYKDDVEQLSMLLDRDLKKWTL